MPTAVYVPKGMDHIETLSEKKAVKLRANGRNNSQHCWPNNAGRCCVRLHVSKRLTGFKLSAKTPNNTQTECATDTKCNIQRCWELLANDAASVCTLAERLSGVDTVQYTEGKKQ